MADFYGSSKEQSWFNDAETPAPVSNTPTVNANVGQGSLPPVVQPFVVVPYVSQMQPLYQYDYSHQMGMEQQQIVDSEQIKEKSKNKVCVSKIFAIIFAILSIAVIVVGKFIDLSKISVLGLNLSLFNIYGVNSGLDIIMTIPNVIKDKDILSMVVAFGMAAVALCAVLSFIVNLLTINRKSKGLKRVLAALQVIFVAAVFIALLKSFGFSDIKYGLYILAGLCILSIF